MDVKIKSNVLENQTILFQKHLPIELNYSKAECYKDCNNYKPAVMEVGFTWHQIVVHHNGNFKDTDGKNAILDAIFEAVNEEEFYPVAYRQSESFDMFLIRQCKGAIDQLFKKNLKIKMPNGLVLLLEIQFNIGTYKFGQLSAHSAIATAINGLLNCMDTYKKHRNILNLSNFHSNLALFDVIVNLANIGVFSRICDLICKNDNKFRTINGIILSNNNITSLGPLKIFDDFPLVLLDLRNNKLGNIEDVCKHLKRIKADYLYLLGNPLVTSPKYPTIFKNLAKNFVLLDDMQTENLDTFSNVSKVQKSISYEGYQIDLINKNDIERFRTSDQWHAVVIPDASGIYDKTTIIGFFFLLFPAELSEFYPCYYMYDGAHKFLLKDAFDQLLFFTNEKKLCFEAPNFSNPNADNQHRINSVLKMDVMPFENGQVEVMKALKAALNLRFDTKRRFLNLSNFQSAKGLENVMINMSVTEILNRVLAIAAKQFSSNCVDICLSHNGIVCPSFAKALVAMKNLRVIDIGNNWIHDLNMLEDLSNLKLDALRLDGNPLCSIYSTSFEYIKAVREMFPRLKMLDNQNISKGILHTHKNFLCSIEAYDFVSQFIPLYFDLFDSNKREILMDMYEPSAILSFSSKLQTNTSTKAKLRSINYELNDTNILKESPFQIKYFVGRSQIRDVFNCLPPMKHDLSSFTTDLILFTPGLVILMVTGVFNDLGEKHNDEAILISFCRTFYLKPVPPESENLKCSQLFKIINECITISSPSADQKNNAFRHDKRKPTEIDETIDHNAEYKIAMLQEITGLKTVWCARCLDDANWDFQKSLEVFEELCIKKKIPENAFK